MNAKNVITHCELLSLLDYDPETGDFKNKVSRPPRGKIGDIAGCLQVNGYWSISIRQKLYLAHRLAWFFSYGEWPSEVDHINGNRIDNRLCNLRDVTRSQNAQNIDKKKHNKSGHKGVYWDKKNLKWFSYINIDRRMIFLGRFIDLHEAVKARKEAELIYHSHARRNE